VTAYVPALVWLAAPPVRILLTVPATDALTVADFGVPSYVTGELPTESVGVAFAIVTFCVFEAALKFAVAAPAA
jgi:hypothetical protein